MIKIPPLKSNEFAVCIIELSTGLCLDPNTNNYKNDDEEMFIVVNSENEITKYLAKFFIENREIIVYNSNAEKIKHLKKYSKKKKSWWKFW